jgi:uncharacterized protein (DUF983 family)
MALHACPHCLQPGISSTEKFHSLFLKPAHCRLCRKSSYLHHTHGLRAMIVWVVFSWVFIGIALYQNVWIYLIGTIPALFFAVDKFILSAPMRPLG